MAIQRDCPSCASGSHENHDASHGITPGLIGGSACHCAGDCPERAVAAAQQVARTWGMPGLLTEQTDVPPLDEANRRLFESILAASTPPGAVATPANPFVEAMRGCVEPGADTPVQALPTGPADDAH